MTITTTTRLVGPLAGDSSTVDFEFFFKVFDEADITVIRTDALGVDTTFVKDVNYTVALNVDQNSSPGGTVTTIGGSSPVATGAFITIASNVSDLQGTSLPSAGPWRSEVVEDALDRAIAITQEQRDLLDRAISFPLTEDVQSFPVLLPEASIRASKWLAFDGSGNLTVTDSPTMGSVTVSAFSETLLDDSSAAAWLTTLGASAFSQTLLPQTDGDGWLGALGLSTVGIDVTTAANADAALTALGFTALARSLRSAATSAAYQGVLGYTAYGSGLVSQADASAALGYLGFSTYGKTLIDDANAASARTTLGFSTYGGGTLGALADLSALRTELDISGFWAGVLNDPDLSTAQTSLGIGGGGGSGTPRGHISGLILSRNGGDTNNDIDISVGEAVDTTQAANMALASALTKQMDANWAVGNNAGSLDTGGVGSGWYHVFLIQRSDTLVVDVLTSTSASAPTMPTNYDRKRRIGSILRDPNNVAFTQRGDEFFWTSPVLEQTQNDPGTAENLAAFLYLPAGVRTTAHLNVVLENTGATITRMLVSSPDEPDSAPSASFATLSAKSSEDACSVRKLSDTSRQIRFRLSFSAAAVTYNATITGYTDTRGRGE